MKPIKLVLSISILFIISESQAQKRLTNREIYNFNVGDIIHTGYTFHAAPIYVKRRFLTKSYSISLDTVKFEVMDSIYTFQSLNNWNLRIKKDTIFYIHLDSFPQPFDQLFKVKSFAISDTIDRDTCGKIYNEILFSNASDSVIILDREYYTQYYLEGLGCYYNHVYQTKDDWAIYHLEYYKKSGIECGVKIGYLTIKNPTELNRFKIIPNPVSDYLMLVLNAPLNNFKIEIADITGKLIEFIPNKSLRAIFTSINPKVV